MSETKEAAVRPAATIAGAGWKSVLVHAEPHAEQRLEVAAALARKCDALLIGLGAELVEPLAFSDPYGGFDALALTAMREQVVENLTHAEASFRKHAGSARGEWLSVEDRPAEALARVSRMADVIVAGGAPLTPANSYRNADPAELAILSGRPVLVAPVHGKALKAETIVVAWKDTREARRALGDAMPLLIAAGEVLVLEVCAEKETETAELHTAEVVAGLKRHGVKARARVAVAPDIRVAEVLDAEAAAIGADLIVAGCYGHSRMNEWLFGGATRGLLHDPQRFILISH